MATNKVEVVLFNREKDQEETFENSNSVGAQGKKRGESVGCCNCSVIKRNKNEDCSQVIVLRYLPF